MALVICSTPTQVSGFGFKVPKKTEQIFASRKLLSWANTLYQEKRFDNFNEAYDEWAKAPRDPESRAKFFRLEKAVKIGVRDINAMEKAWRAGEFDLDLGPLIEAARAVFAEGKNIICY
jgi:hypothetical protein